MAHHIAQLNVARLLHPLDHPATEEFVDALDKVNELAESSAGFVWRLTDDAGNSSSYVELPGNTDPLLIVNYSIWEDVETLRQFVYRSAHSDYLRRKREWFESSREATVVCWWIPAGEIPDLEEAHRCLLTLREQGPSEVGWPLNRPVAPPAIA